MDTGCLPLFRGKSASLTTPSSVATVRLPQPELGPRKRNVEGRSARPHAATPPARPTTTLEAAADVLPAESVIEQDHDAAILLRANDASGRLDHLLNSW